MKCPFCHFENEDGVLFCEQCKSDLAVAPAAAVPVAPAEPLRAEAIPAGLALPAEAIPLSVEETFPAASHPMLEAVPVIAEAVPVAAEEAPAVAMAVPMMASAPATPEVAVMPPAPITHEMTPPPAAPVAAIPAVEAAAHAIPAVVVPAAPPAAPVAAAVAVSAAPVVEASNRAPATVQAPAVAMAPGAPLPAGAQPRLLVLRGQKRNVEYPIYEGLNFIGRADDKPVDIDLEDQEPPDRVWCSRQHACIGWEGDHLEIEDLNSANGTYVNRTRIYPGQKRPLSVNDIIQIGNVQLKVIA